MQINVEQAIEIWDVEVGATRKPRFSCDLRVQQRSAARRRSGLKSAERVDNAGFLGAAMSTL
ncbi:hypothetical protein ACFSHT_31715 [Paraburkholderia silviterrae]|uniref:Uncharacterized protein n=1 Tax=Paraburkholderia silviterrae TaxID=2528715 RepID=A0A4R5M381_9BURK|nr:hypothetical protein [Paraburkholderia silviterrae]TDG20147.1 hypothetical protein EYW47_26985 [Paraburkholderia silviterrae]